MSAPRLHRDRLGGRARLLVSTLCVLPAATPALGQEAATALYIRSDTNATTVYTPRLRAALPVADDTELDVAYSVDVWTSASVDIVASATKVVTEQRDQLDLGVSQELGSFGRMGAAYRYSTEPDYESHGGSLRLEADLANKAATLAASVFVGFDRVGRAGDPNFDEQARSVNGKLSFSQVLDKETLVQGIYELRFGGGYMSSPYRFIGIGGEDWTCRGTVLYCVPESNPDKRFGHAVALRGTRALGEHFSVGAGYRFYIDDWAMRSHTIDVRGSWLPARHTQLTLRYRFYTQSAAEQWFPKYDEPVASGYYTGDKELSSLNDHQIGLDAQQNFVVGDEGELLRLMLAVGPTFYTYRDYLLLDAVTAFEATVAVVLEL